MLTKAGGRIINNSGSPMVFYTDLHLIHAGMNAGMALPFERRG